MKDLYRTIILGITICLVAWLTSGCGVSNWNNRDKWFLAGSTVAMGADMYTTDRAIKAGYVEAGFPQYVIGEQPSSTDLMLWGIGTQLLIMWWADRNEEWRPWLLGITGGVHAGAAVYNWQEVE